MDLDLSARLDRVYVTTADGVWGVRLSLGSAQLLHLSTQAEFTILPEMCDIYRLVAAAPTTNTLFLAHSSGLYSLNPDTDARDGTANATRLCSIGVQPFSLSCNDRVCLVVEIKSAILYNHDGSVLERVRTRPDAYWAAGALFENTLFLIELDGDSKISVVRRSLFDPAASFERLQLSGATLKTTYNAFAVLPRGEVFLNGQVFSNMGRCIVKHKLSASLNDSEDDCLLIDDADELHLCSKAHCVGSTLTLAEEDGYIVRGIVSRALCKAHGAPVEFVQSLPSGDILGLCDDCERDDTAKTVFEHCDAENTKLLARVEAIRAQYISAVADAAEVRRHALKHACKPRREVLFTASGRFAAFFC